MYPTTKHNVSFSPMINLCMRWCHTPVNEVTKMFSCTTTSLCSSHCYKYQSPTSYQMSELWLLNSILNLALWLWLHISLWVLFVFWILGAVSFHWYYGGKYCAKKKKSLQNFCMKRKSRGITYITGPNSLLWKCQPIYQNVNYLVIIGICFEIVGSRRPLGPETC